VPGLRDGFDGATSVSRVLRMTFEPSVFILVDQNSQAHFARLLRDPENRGFQQTVFLHDSVTVIAFWFVG
jgi:hypothetical protein